MALTLKLFVAYVRVSTDEQVVSGLGLAAQQERLRAYVTAHGGELMRLYRDEGYSGTLTASKRPGLGQLLADAERLPAGTTILVLRLDRLARHTLEALTIEAELRRRGLRLASVCEQLDAGTPAGRAMIQMLASFAELESGLIGERTFAAMRT
jgi:site-specific DNA recombinase